MADATTVYAVDNSQDYSVIPNTVCKRISVQENYDSSSSPTADLLQKIPASAASAVKVAKGLPAIYTSATFFQPGVAVGMIRTSAGSITVQQVESNSI